jgi:fused signal recognition particle receptor
MDNIFTKWKEGLSKTSRATFGQIAAILGTSDITPETWDDLEALLIQADLGMETVDKVLDALEERVDREGLVKTYQLRDGLREELRALLKAPRP